MDWRIKPIHPSQKNTIMEPRTQQNFDPKNFLRAKVISPLELERLVGGNVDKVRVKVRKEGGETVKEVEVSQFF